MLDIFSCCKSADAVSKEPVPEQSKDASGAAKPQPQLFAIMRNGHEVIRDASKATSKAISNDDKEGAKKSWGELHRFSEIHKKMEEGNGGNDSPKGFFRVLDERCDNIATKEGLFDAHEELDKREKAVDNAFEDGGDSLSKEFEAFQEENEKHLKKEEDIMMPKVQEMKKGGAPMKKIMREEILATVWDSPDFEFFVTFAVQTLGKRENKQAVKVFSHALWAAASKDQWAKWNVWVKASVSDDVYAEMQPLFAEEK